MTAKYPVLTIVTYHYIRDIAASRWPGIKGLERAQFERQLDFLQHHHTSVSMAMLFAHARGEHVDWPDRPLLLTFDDGYSEHFATAFRELSKRGIPGAFFAPTLSLLDRHVLDVNKVHFVLAKVPDHEKLSAEVEAHLRDMMGPNAAREIAAFRRDMWKPSRWDPAPTVYIKRILQRGPPAAIRSAVASQLFQTHVSTDQQAFAEDLYLTPAQAREMCGAGMHFGSHGHQHIWFNHSTRAEQESDIVESLRLRTSLGLKPGEHSFCYPYGGYDTHTLDLMKLHGFGVGLTTRLALNPLDGHTSMLELARIDAGADVPEGRTAEPRGILTS